MFRSPGAPFRKWRNRLPISSGTRSQICSEQWEAVPQLQVVLFSGASQLMETPSQDPGTNTRQPGTLQPHVGNQQTKAISAVRDFWVLRSEIPRDFSFGRYRATSRASFCASGSIINLALRRSLRSNSGSRAAYNR
jgi:hypothetical protein